MNIRPLRAGDFPAVLALNAAAVHYLSPLDAPGLAALADAANIAWVLADQEQVGGFLLALREGANYASVNYQWFARRHARFLYIDRVVLAPAWQGGGNAAALYDALFAQARADAVDCVACEFDLLPPNPRSARFHARWGFCEVGQQSVGDGKKTVSLQIADATRMPPLPE